MNPVCSVRHCCHVGIGDHQLLEMILCVRLHVNRHLQLQSPCPFARGARQLIQLMKVRKVLLGIFYTETHNKNAAATLLRISSKLFIHRLINALQFGKNNPSREDVQQREAEVDTDGNEVIRATLALHGPRSCLAERIHTAQNTGVV
jgi:hypothetical protein